MKNSKSKILKGKANVNDPTPWVQQWDISEKRGSGTFAITGLNYRFNGQTNTADAIFNTARVMCITILLDQLSNFILTSVDLNCCYIVLNYSAGINCTINIIKNSNMKHILIRSMALQI